MHVNLWMLRIFICSCMETSVISCYLYTRVRLYITIYSQWISIGAHESNHIQHHFYTSNGNRSYRSHLQHMHKSACSRPNIMFLYYSVLHTRIYKYMPVKCASSRPYCTADFHVRHEIKRDGDINCEWDNYRLHFNAACAYATRRFIHSANKSTPMFFV